MVILTSLSPVARPPPDSEPERMLKTRPLLASAINRGRDRRVLNKALDNSSQLSVLRSCLWSEGRPIATAASTEKGCQQDAVLFGTQLTQNLPYFFRGARRLRGPPPPDDEHPAHLALPQRLESVARDVRLRELVRVAQQDARTVQGYVALQTDFVGEMARDKESIVRLRAARSFLGKQKVEGRRKTFRCLPGRTW